VLSFECLDMPAHEAGPLGRDVRHDVLFEPIQIGLKMAVHMRNRVLKLALTHCEWVAV
jgi:hypothetical protein